MALQTPSFPSTQITSNPDSANYQNYLAWQTQTAHRRRQSQTQFNLYQTRTAARTCDQAAYKEEAARDEHSLKQLIERRLSQACDCEACDSAPGDGSGEGKERSNSDASSSSAGSSRSSMSCLTASSREPVEAGTVVKGPTSPSSKNSLITSPPPRSRHHHRRRARTLPG